MIPIGEASNYYGGVFVKEQDGLYYWGIEDHDGSCEWEEIPARMYKALLSFEKGRRKKLIQAKK